jgi:hypothetical protein
MRSITSVVTLSILLALGLLCGTNPSAAQAPAKKGLRRIFSADPLLNKIVSYAYDRRGTAVEFEKRPPGEKPQCTDLVNAALVAAGAKKLEIRNAIPAQKKLGSPDEIYVWGTQMVGLGKGPNRSRALPAAGMIIQFYACSFQKKDASGQVVYKRDMPERHTAIVKSAKGTMVTVLHQNAGGDGTVREDTFDLAWLVKTSSLPLGSGYDLFMPLAAELSPKRLQKIKDRAQGSGN